MTTTFNDKTGLWACTEGNITVRGPSRSGCEERVRDLAERFRLIHEEKINEQRSLPEIF
jgi:hypothetical protein